MGDINRQHQLSVVLEKPTLKGEIPALDLIRIDVFVGSLIAKSWILVVEVSESLSELMKKNLCKIERPTWNPNKSVETLCFQWTDHFQVTCPIR